MNDDRLTEHLVAQVLGWKVAPERFMKPGKAWTPSWKFAPLKNLDHAFELLDHADCVYTLVASKTWHFNAEVRVGGRTGRASGEPKARTITIALARALGIDVSDDGSDPLLTPQHRPTPRPRSKADGK